ncbi:MAG: Ig-like domain-containing protein [Thermodesulfovibrionales bacterium]
MKLQRGKIFIILPTICFLLLSNSACGLDLPKARVTLKVVDEKGVPIKGAKANLTIEGSQKINKTISSLTDKDGISTVAEDSTGYVWYGVEIDGWYKSRGEYRFSRHEAGKWQPWNPEIKVVMRKIEKPVPMYARQTGSVKPDIEIPVINKEIGFDLMECDWISPYGKGKHADFTFKLEKTFKSRDDFDSTLVVTFPNKFDGIQVVKENLKGGSMFKLPRYAPEDGYLKKITHRKIGKGMGAPTDDYGADNNYIFRVRSEEKDGKLIRAMYGKINGEIRFDPMNSKTAYIIFKYFLNPDYTRNLEYGENLFKDLKSTEQVRSDN